MSHYIRFHPSVADDLDWIAEWISDYAGAASAAAKLDEIEQTIRGLSLTPHKGSRRDEIAPGLRAIPAGRKGVVVFAVDDDLCEVLIYAVSYGGADWVRRSKPRI
ncbi:type II toxin-antitoxin system RelE/ParE family toxin [Sinirhodobacter huangdaonensis]|uniref:Type II toxin-antitoxin system RelE/ParE family toxin n=1 Tax=Paenirhodobacter huangdaonensis TaxID=2501515 RepID=A0A443LEV3_9RHOB|nr:type II toxin-antitoxin system RelE/ParE family toxin [Sinirhodobacter huangdaonensis]RWR47732.1 type II toxin-antitoxin system RelE/ParE family toxin [Sinirhodobacter huangdaonensis]